MLQIQRGIRQADVVEHVVDFIRRDHLANALFDLVAELGGLFDAEPVSRAQMQDEGAVIRAGEEVLAQERNEQKEAKAEA